MTPEERRKQHNEDVRRRMKEGEPLMTERQPFPIRPTIQKDKRQIARTLDPESP